MKATFKTMAVIIASIAAWELLVGPAVKPFFGGK